MNTTRPFGRADTSKITHTEKIKQTTALNLLLVATVLCMPLPATGSAEEGGTEPAAVTDGSAEQRSLIELADAENSKRTEGLNDRYVQAVVALQQRFQQAEQLRPALEASEEVERFKQEKTVKPRNVLERVPELARLQTSYIQKASAIRAGLLRELRSRYEPEVRRLTRIGDLKKAKRLDEELRSLGALLSADREAANAVATAGPMSIASARAVAVSAPRPEIPYEARRLKLTGSGVFVMTVDPNSGSVTRVEIAQSTGSPMLDNAATSAFRRWRFAPGSVSMVTTPINFTLTGAEF